MYRLATLLLGLGLIGTPAVAELYKWIGADGKINYSDTPPPADAKKVEKKRLNDRVSEGDGLDFATRNASKKYPVVLYASDCGAPCDQGRALLVKRGVPHVEKNPEKNLEDSKELKKLIGTLFVPDLQVGKNAPLKGFDAAAWNAALDAAGYPKSAAPLKANATKEVKDSKSADAKPKPRKEDIGNGKGLPNPAGGAGTGGGGAGGGGGRGAVAGGGGNGGTNGTAGSNEGPAFTNKADPNARSGPYHEADLPPSATKNQTGSPTELSKQQIDEMEGIKR